MAESAIIAVATANWTHDEGMETICYYGVDN